MIEKRLLEKSCVSIKGRYDGGNKESSLPIILSPQIFCCEETFLALPGCNRAGAIQNHEQPHQDNW